MDQPGTSYRICVFRSPERYDDYYREYVEIPHPNSFTHARTLDSYIENFGMVPNKPLLKTIRLQKYRASLHISYEMLRSLGIDLFRTQTLNLQENQTQQALLLTIFRRISELTDRRVREEERDTSEHTIILDSVELIQQIETNRLLIDLVVYACQHRDAELCHRYFQDYFHRLCHSIRLQNTNISDTETGAIRRIGISNEAGITQEDINRSYEWLNNLRWTENFTPPTEKYNKWKPEAEEKALKLLKEVLDEDWAKSKNILYMSDFEHYKNRGEIIIKVANKVGMNTYKIRKNAMIEVQKIDRKNKLQENYRLCIEPKNYGTICPTDEVVAKIKLIQADENKLHKLSKRFEGK